MPEAALTLRSPLAGLAAAGRFGTLGGDAGVTLREDRGLQITVLIAGRNQVSDVRRAALVVGVTLPSTSSFTTIPSGVVLWAGPEQWVVVSAPSASKQIGALIESCRSRCMIVDQSDARAIVSVSGSEARHVLAKLVGVDLHPRSFRTGDTALTPIGGLPGQIWQAEDTPRFTLSVPRSYAGTFWHSLSEAGAEYGCTVVE